MPVVARVERKHAVAQNGRRHARLVLGQHRRRVKGNDQVLCCGAEKIARGKALHKGIPPHVGRQVVLAAGDNVLVVEGKAGYARLFGGARHKVFKVGHAYIGLEFVNQARNLVDITLPVPQQGKGAANGCRHVHLVVFEHRAQIGQAAHGKFRLKNLGRVVVCHKKKFVP